jgi:5'-nucleotidase
VTRVLVTNDDGIESPGLHALARLARDLGLDVVVAAPAWDSSGASASLTAVQEGGRVLVEPITLPALEGVTAFAAQAAPGFIALTASRGAFGAPPDLVVSGINRGPNTGHAILHSGTVGAALTASTHGCRAMAVSLGVGEPPQWRTAVEVAGRVLRWLVDADAGLVLNVNVPNVSVSELRGLRRARLAAFGAVQTNVTKLDQGYVRLSYSDIDAVYEPGTDAQLLDAGYATVTALLAVCEAHGADLAALAEPPDIRDDMRAGSG